MKNHASVILIIFIITIIHACGIVDEQECYNSNDCGDNKICCDGKCCEDNTDTDPIPVDDDPKEECGCPEDMVLINNSFCMDVYEASRVDATETSRGQVDELGISAPHVMPWVPVDYETAKSACESVGKRLCRDYEWEWVCQNGPSQFVYSYGDEYIADICNGIDAFCEAPFPHCRESNDYFFKLQPTGTFQNCFSPCGVFDLNGNVWEWVEGTDGDDNHLRGGAYNCSNSERLHKCTHKAYSEVSARGFRCCSDESCQ